MTVKLFLSPPGSNALMFSQFFSRLVEGKSEGGGRRLIGGESCAGHYLGYEGVERKRSRRSRSIRRGE